MYHNGGCFPKTVVSTEICRVPCVFTDDTKHNWKSCRSPSRIMFSSRKTVTQRLLQPFLSEKGAFLMVRKEDREVTDKKWDQGPKLSFHWASFGGTFAFLGGTGSQGFRAGRKLNMKYCKTPKSMNSTRPRYSWGSCSRYLEVGLSWNTKKYRSIILQLCSFYRMRRPLGTTGCGDCIQGNH